MQLVDALLEELQRFVIGRRKPQISIDLIQALDTLADEAPH